VADTIQLVTWSLEQKCLLRPGKEDASPQIFEGLLASAKSYSAGLRDNKKGFGVFGDIYVSSYTFGTKPSSNVPTPSLSYPVEGFVASHEFRDFGGPEDLFRMCGNCPANTTPHDLVGCAGSLYQFPNSIETEDQLRRIVARLGIEAEVHAAFPQTTPMWYGLWAVSPVPKRSLTVLRTLISEMLADDRGDTSGKVDERQLRDFALFIKAIDLALERNLQLQVALLPLGHTDLGGLHDFSPLSFLQSSGGHETVATSISSLPSVVPRLRNRVLPSRDGKCQENEAGRAGLEGGSRKGEIQGVRP
jgi:hypothetical protein